MSSVYVLFWEATDDQHILGIYDSEQKAETARQEMAHNRFAVVECWTLNVFGDQE